MFGPLPLGLAKGKRKKASGLPVRAGLDADAFGGVRRQSFTD